MIKAIAVDFGGVYYTWDGDKYVDQLVRETGAEPVRIKLALERMHDYQTNKITKNEFWKVFGKTIGKPVDSEHLHALTKKQFKPNPPVINLLAHLRTQGFLIVLLCNQTAILDEIDKTDNVFEKFDFVINSYHEGIEKPDPRIYRLFLKRAKVKADEAIFIDDQQKMVSAAEQLGIRGIHYIHGMNLVSALHTQGILEKNLKIEQAPRTK